MQNGRPAGRPFVPLVRALVSGLLGRDHAYWLVFGR